MVERYTIYVVERLEQQLLQVVVVDRRRDVVDGLITPSTLL